MVHTLKLCRRWLSGYALWSTTGNWPEQGGNLNCTGIYLPELKVCLTSRPSPNPMYSSQVVGLAGGQVALQLVMSGVKHFTLIDNDVVKI